MSPPPKDAASARSTRGRPTPDLREQSLVRHPQRDDLIPDMIDAGLTAVEAFHSEHDAATTERYLAFAERSGIAVSGGSDYHGEKERRKAAFGTIGLPQDRFERLKARLRET